MMHHFNVSGPERKALVEAISNILETKAKYLGMPSAAYEIGSYTVSKDGTLSWADLDDADPAHLAESCGLINELERLGFHSEEAAFWAAEEEALEASDGGTEDAQEAAAAPETEAEGATEQETIEPAEGATKPENGPADEDTAEPESAPTVVDNGAEGTISIRVPLSTMSETAVGNLKALLAAKGGLIRQALGGPNPQVLPVLWNDEGCIDFPWLPCDAEAETVNAWTEFIGALCRMAREAKRVTVKEKEAVNPKYEFRCFLLRLGFIGNEYKATRKTLLANLPGSAAFKAGKKEAPDCSE